MECNINDKVERFLGWHRAQQQVGYNWKLQASSYTFGEDSIKSDM